MVQAHDNATVGAETDGPERMPGEPSVELLTVRDVARVCRCSPRQVYRMADAGRMPRPVRLGTLVRWPRAAILRWIADGCPAVRAAGGAR